jgi:hypothetical protein
MVLLGSACIGANVTSKSTDILVTINVKAKKRQHDLVVTIFADGCSRSKVLHLLVQ